MKTVKGVVWKHLTPPVRPIKPKPTIKEQPVFYTEWCECTYKELQAVIAAIIKDYNLKEDEVGIVLQSYGYDPFQLLITSDVPNPSYEKDLETYKKDLVKYRTKMKQYKKEKELQEKQQRKRKIQTTLTSLSPEEKKILLKELSKEITIETDG